MFDLQELLDGGDDPRKAAILDDINSAWAEAWLNRCPVELRDQCDRDNQEVLRRIFILGFAYGAKWQRNQP
jgi:hypothetical protein